MKFQRYLVVAALMLACLSWTAPVRAERLEDQIQKKIRERMGQDERGRPLGKGYQVAPQSPVDPELLDPPLAIDPRKFPVGSRVLSNQSYGPDPKQKLDVYSPASARSAPILIMVHGGAWKQGDKAYAPVVQNKAIHWLPKGYIIVSLNYRMSPQANPVVQASDVMSAIAWVQKNSPLWGGDPNKIILMGHSSGGHLVSLISGSPETRIKAGLRPWLGTIVLDGLAFDAVKTMKQKHYAFYDDVFGKNSALWTSASPTHQLKAGVVPMLLICTPLRQNSCPLAEEYAQKITALGGQGVVHAENLKHADINTQLGLPGTYTDIVDKVMTALLTPPVAPAAPAPLPAPTQAPAPVQAPATTPAPAVPPIQ